MVRKGTVMEGTKMPYRTWAIGLYLHLTNIKGISSMRLHRELGITQKSAWFMLHRLREASKSDPIPFSGPVETDETISAGWRATSTRARNSAPDVVQSARQSQWRERQAIRSSRRPHDR